MKIKIGFVSNSSSCSFIIINKTDTEKSIVDFVKETPHLIEEFCEEYDYKPENGYNQEKLIKSAEENNIFFKPNEIKGCIFGDEQETLIGQVYDYILRDGVISESFEVRFDEFLR